MKSTRQKRDRRKWLMEGLCTRCGKSPPKENCRFCDRCGEKGVQYMIERRYKLRILEDDDDRD